jgi:hypothetical protein
MKWYFSSKNLISYKEDLNNPSAINDSSYFAQFEPNMDNLFVDQALDQKLSDQNIA